MKNESETRFTPGPWAVHRHGAIVGGPFQEYTNGSSQEQIAMVCILSATEGDAVGERDANAHLIAAAPDLLAAVKFAMKYGAMQAQKGNPLPSQLMGALRGAIAKAEPLPVRDQIVTPIDDEYKFSKY